MNPYKASHLYHLYPHVRPRPFPLADHINLEGSCSFPYGRTWYSAGAMRRQHISSKHLHLCNASAWKRARQNWYRIRIDTDCIWTSGQLHQSWNGKELHKNCDKSFVMTRDQESIYLWHYYIAKHSEMRSDLSLLGTYIGAPISC